MKPFALSALVLAAAIGATTAHAEDFIPDLTGTWNAVDGMVILADGKVNKYPDDYEVNQLVISDQTGSVFKVTQTIKPKKPMAATHGGASLAGQPRQMLGVINGTGPLVKLADIGDGTVVDCNLEDEGRMSCTFAEPGDNAVAGYAVMERGN